MDTEKAGSSPAAATRNPHNKRRLRRVLMLGAMVVVIALVMLAARPEGPASWRAGLAERDDAGESSQSPTLTPAPAELATAPVGTDGAAAGTAAGGGRTQVSPSAAGGQGEGSRQPGTRPVTEPIDSAQPPAPRQPEAHLDSVFGEGMFSAPAKFKQVQVFDVDDDEVTVTYKSDGTADIDLLRVTVFRAESSAAASKHLDSVAGVLGGKRVTYAWGGRNITQVTGGIERPEGEPVGFLWTQGRYAIDVVMYAPYLNGQAAGREDALGFIGRLGY